jgi:alpha-glucosidase
MQEFTAGDRRLNSAYGFDFLYADKLTPALVAKVASEWPENAGWPSWAFENHDAPRAISRWVDDLHRDAFARMKMLLLCSLRGSIILYQGEELGLPQVDVPFERLQDPEAIANWPHTLSRDGARTPMPWKSSGAGVGFSTGDPWLPIGASHPELAVDVQERTSNSLLRFTRECLALRARTPALRQGSIDIVEASDALLIFDRILGFRRLRCTFNLLESIVQFSASGRTLIRAGPVDGASLGPYAALIEEIE